MELLHLAAALIVLCAAFSYLNHRYLGLPTTIGVMLIALLTSLGLLGLGRLGLGFPHAMAQAVRGIDFNVTVMHGMLGFLLFAGALHIDLDRLREQRRIVSTLATVGVLLGTLLTGGAVWLLFNALGLQVPWLYCLLFGALISPTDPIAVLGVLKQVDAPRSIETKIAGEALFNDGVGVVVFLAVLGIVSGGHDVNVTSVLGAFLQEAIGGIVFGLLIGYLAYRMLKSVDNYQVEVLITLALVMGGYALADVLHTSGPLAMVVAGLLIGNPGRADAMSLKTRQHLDMFWELIDEILNAALFVLIGLEILALTFRAEHLAAGLLTIPLVLCVRFISVGLPVAVLRRFRTFSPHAVKVLTWSGLRGGISVALALSLPAGPERDLLVTVTYAVVTFSILVQGVTIGPLLRRLYPEARQSAG